MRDLGGPDLGSLMSFGNSRTLFYRPEGDALTAGDRDVVRSMTSRHGVRSDAATYRVYDPRRPLASLVFAEPGAGPLGRGAEALGIDLPGEVSGALGAAAQVAGAAAGGIIGDIGEALGMAVGQAELEVYEHHDHFLLPDWDYARKEPKRMLQSQKADQRLGRGTSLCPLVACGRRFTLADHPIEWVNQEYAIVEVRHVGHAHDALANDAEEPVYENEFACVPSDVPFLPPRPPRRSVQTCLTATVIGAESEAELQTHTMGEIKVRFHWERNARGTCWVRCMQAWSGAGWGTQFMPRIGMEVVVGFEGGDPDKPIVLGCLYNGTHPTPYTLPESQTRSGIRTHSTPGGEGFNELSFEDRKDAELVYLHAERDHEVKVKHDRRTVVDHDDSTRVENDQQLVVRGAQHTRIDGRQELVVREQRRIEVEGSHELVTRGDHSERVGQNATIEVGGGLTRQVGGSSAEIVAGDVTRRTRGSVAELVQSTRSIQVEGIHQLSSAGATEIVSEEEVVLRVGSSSLRVSEDRIEIIAPEIVLAADGATARLGNGDMKLLVDGTLQAVADKVLLKSSGASMGLSSEASVEGSRVLLNSPATASDSVESEEPEPTVIELRDQDGNPVPNQRYRIELEDGSAMTGVLDEDGRAEVFLEGGGEVVFPDLGEVQPS